MRFSIGEGWWSSSGARGTWNERPTDEEENSLESSEELFVEP